MNRSLFARRSVTAAAAMFALALAGASVAWACASVQPKLNSSQANGHTAAASGPAGSQITLTGRDFSPGPVEVRWNARTGKLLGQAQGPSFSVTVRIPDTAPVGVHYILAIPTAGNTATLAFEVTSSTGTSSGTSGSTGTSATAAGGEEESTTASASTQKAGTGEQSTATSGGESPNGQSSTGSRSATEDSTVSGSTQAESTPNRTDATQTAKAAVVNASAPVRSGAAQAAASPAVATTPAGQAVFGGSTAQAGPEMPAAATVSADTWSGFAGDAGKPSLLDDDLATLSSGSTSASGVGMALLGAGLVALFAGFGAAEVARKRAVASTTNSR